MRQLSESAVRCPRNALTKPHLSAHPWPARKLPQLRAPNNFAFVVLPYTLYVVCEGFLRLGCLREKHMVKVYHAQETMQFAGALKLRKPTDSFYLMFRKPDSVWHDPIFEVFDFTLRKVAFDVDVLSTP